MKENYIVFRTVYISKFPYAVISAPLPQILQIRRSLPHQQTPQVHRLNRLHHNNRRPLLDSHHHNPHHFIGQHGNKNPQKRDHYYFLKRPTLIRTIIAKIHNRQRWRTDVRNIHNGVQLYNESQTIRVHPPPGVIYNWPRFGQLSQHTAGSMHSPALQLLLLTR